MNVKRSSGALLLNIVHVPQLHLRDVENVAVGIQYHCHAFLILDSWYLCIPYIRKYGNAMIITGTILKVCLSKSENYLKRPCLMYTFINYSIYLYLHLQKHLLGYYGNKRHWKSIGYLKPPKNEPPMTNSSACIYRHGLFFCRGKGAWRCLDTDM